jgi:hypothetical protein
MELVIDASNSISSSSAGTSKRDSPCRVKMASNSCLIIACGTENDGTEEGTADGCTSPLAEDKVVGLSDPSKLGLVTGLAGIGSEEAVGKRGRRSKGKSLTAGYLALFEVTFLEAGSLVSLPAELLLCCIIATLLTEVVAATAKMVTIMMVIWAAIDKPQFLAVAAAAIFPAPVAADVPADAAALTAID